MMMSTTNDDDIRSLLLSSFDDDGLESSLLLLSWREEKEEEHKHQPEKIVAGTSLSKMMRNESKMCAYVDVNDHQANKFSTKERSQDNQKLQQKAYVSWNLHI